MGSGTSLMTSLSLNHLLTGSISNTVTLEGGHQQGDLGTGFNPLKSLCFSPL